MGWCLYLSWKCVSGKHFQLKYRHQLKENVSPMDWWYYPDRRYGVKLSSLAAPSLPQRTDLNTKLIAFTKYLEYGPRWSLKICVVAVHFTNAEISSNYNHHGTKIQSTQFLCQENEVFNNIIFVVIYLLSTPSVHEMRRCEK